ncbi:MAG: beta-lactamase family protein, partial [Clostridia bacterium]|nr:beta-lactamase family protein [Clostridia bacterium]
MNLNDLPGLAIGVSVGGVDGGSDQPAEFVGVRGYRDYFARVPLQEDDIFHCASVSKLFTSSAIMKLAEAGALQLEDRLCDLLPDLHIADQRFQEIRLWNMLTHTSGLGDVDDYHWYDFETDEDSLRRYVYASAEVLDQSMLWNPQEHPAGEENRFRYSNVAYEILGQIIAEYSNRMPDADGTLSYEDFVAKYLLKPAGMTGATMKTFERDLNQITQPYEKKADRSIGPVDDYPYTRQHAPSSTLTANVCDLLRWGRAHLASARGGGPLLKAEIYQTIWRDYATVPNNGEKMGIG